MKCLENFIGKRFGKWVVISNSDRKRYLLCRCDCGTSKEVRHDSLEIGDSTSCGCESSKKAGDRLRTHGMSSHHLYHTWYDMIRRCKNSKRKDYIHYGGRGIKVCDRWLEPEGKGFLNFLEDMESSYKEGLELDRRDVNGNYEPSNCRWVTRRCQVINRRPTGKIFDAKFITYDNKTMCFSEWADFSGLPCSVLKDRITTLGWNFERAISEPLRVKQYYIEVNQEFLKLRDYFKINRLNIAYFFTYKIKHSLEECCSKFLSNLDSFKIYGKYNGETILLLDSTQEENKQ